MFSPAWKEEVYRSSIWKLINLGQICFNTALPFSRSQIPKHVCEFEGDFDSRFCALSRLVMYMFSLKQLSNCPNKVWSRQSVDFGFFKVLPRGLHLHVLPVWSNLMQIFFYLEAWERTMMLQLLSLRSITPPTWIRIWKADGIYPMISDSDKWIFITFFRNTLSELSTWSFCIQLTHAHQTRKCHVQLRFLV